MTDLDKILNPRKPESSIFDFLHDPEIAMFSKSDALAPAWQDVLKPPRSDVRHLYLRVQ